MFGVLGLTQVITTPTRCIPIKNTLIDHCYINMLYPSICGTIDLDIRDHKLIFICKKKPLIKHARSKFIGRDLHNFHTTELYENLSAHNWGRFYELTCPNAAWNYLKAVLLNVVNTLCPIREFYCIKDKPEWYTHEVTE